MTLPLAISSLLSAGESKLIVTLLSQRAAGAVSNCKSVDEPDAEPDSP